MLCRSIFYNKNPGHVLLPVVSAEQSNGDDKPPEMAFVSQNKDVFVSSGDNFAVVTFKITDEE